MVAMPTLYRSNTDSTLVPSPPQNMARATSRPVKMSLSDFHLLRVLGKGCMGKVFLARSVKDNGQCVAIKAITKKRLTKLREQKHVRKERDILATLSNVNHPFLITLMGAFQDDDTLFLVLEYHPGGDIATELTRLGKFDPKRIQFYATELVLGIAELHRLGIVYRDLKPENILIARDGHLVLTDFGLSKQFMQSGTNTPDGTRMEGEDVSVITQELMTDTFCGTAEYLAPEVLRGEKYGFAVDWWSLGTLLYEMYFGITPFWAEDHLSMYHRVLSEPLKFDRPIVFDAQAFLMGLLKRNPKQRLGYGPDDAKAVKRHPYFSTVDWNQVMLRKTQPPFIPEIKHDQDLRHFDKEFLDMTPKLSHVDGPYSNLFGTDMFHGFSFCANGLMPPPVTSSGAVDDASSDVEMMDEDGTFGMDL
jgi:serine/threonine protein kinase